MKPISDTTSMSRKDVGNALAVDDINPALPIIRNIP